MGKDPLDHGRVVDRGDRLHPPGASAEPTSRGGPGCAPAPRPEVSRHGSRICRRATLRAVMGDDLGPPACVWCQQAVIKRQVDLRLPRQGRELLEELHGLEEDVWSRRARPGDGPQGRRVREQALCNLRAVVEPVGRQAPPHRGEALVRPCGASGGRRARPGVARQMRANAEAAT
jgi:hypothetical protein